jgi:hypothetical protein
MLSRNLDDSFRKEDGSCIVAPDSLNSNILYIGTINSRAWIGDPLTTKDEDRKPNASIHLHQGEPVWSIQRRESTPDDPCNVAQVLISFVKNSDTNERSWNEIWNDRETLTYR